MGRHVKIDIEVVAGNLTFTDDRGNVSPDEHIQQSDIDTVEWISHAGDIEITFSDGGLFHPPVSFPIKASKDSTAGPFTLNPNHPKAEYKYSATLIADGKRIKVDPRIIFDVVNTLGSSSPADLVKAVEQAWEKLFDKLSSLKGPESASGIPLYKCGINNISVSVEVAGFTISVQVQGPDSCS